jgi:aspartate 1-decarboxylase
MLRRMCKSKIHRATVTQADLDYEGSIAIDTDLLKAADVLPYEMVQIFDINNGERFETYAIPGEAGSGTMCVNGAAARLVQRGDLLIVLSYTMMEDKEALGHKPRVVFVDSRNQIVETTNKVATGGDS